MGKTLRSRSARKIAMVHFTRRPFPVDPAFFGQNFIPLSMCMCSRNSPHEVRNHVFVNRAPRNEDIMRDMEEMSEQKFNAKLRFGYSVGRSGRIASIAKKLVDEGFLPVLDFHYPLQDSRLMQELDRKFTRMGIRKHVLIVNHLHVTPPYLKLMSNDIRTERGRRSCKVAKTLDELSRVFQVSDLTIGVSEEAINAFRRISYTAGGRSGDFETALGDRWGAVLNGISPLLYTPRSQEEKDEARGAMGLSEEAEVAACYVARLDGLKGANTLLHLLKIFNGWYGNWHDNYSFVLAASDIIYPVGRIDHMRKIFDLRRLIMADRLKLVIDISKFTRGDPRFRDATIRIIEHYAQPEFQEIKEHRIFGGYLDIPVQGITDMMVHTAVHEALGLALVEANFSSNFVVARAVGGIPEVIPTNERGTVSWPVKGGSSAMLDREFSYSEFGVLIDHSGPEQPELDAEAFEAVMRRLKPNKNGSGPTTPIGLRQRFSDTRMTDDYINAVLAAHEVRL